MLTTKFESTELKFDIEHVAVEAHEYSDHIYLDAIVVDVGHRNKGLGSQALRRVIRHAEQACKPLVAYVSDELGGDIERLDKWYQAHGFYKEWNHLITEYNYNYRRD